MSDYVYLAINGVPKCESPEYGSVIARYVVNDYTDLYKALVGVVCSYPGDQSDAAQRARRHAEDIVHIAIPGAVVTWISGEEHARLADDADYIGQED